MEKNNTKKILVDKYSYEEAEKMALHLIDSYVCQDSLDLLDQSKMTISTLSDFYKYYYALADEKNNDVARLQSSLNILKDWDSISEALEYSFDDNDVKKILSSTASIYYFTSRLLRKKDRKGENVDLLSIWNIILNKKGNRLLGFSLKKENFKNDIQIYKQPAGK